MKIFKTFTLKSKMKVIAALFTLTYVLFMNLNIVGIAKADNTDESYITKNYYVAKKAFDNQKQAVIDAYNTQVDKINIYGLKTKNDFHGLKFKTDVFKNNSDSLKNAINSDFENAVSLPNYKKSERKAKISKLVDRLNSNVAVKIAKIKAFYEAKIRKIYDSLQKWAKVDFDNLKEYSTNNKTGNFSHKDFDFISLELKKDKTANDNENDSSFRGTLIAMAAAFVIFTLIIALVCH